MTESPRLRGLTYTALGFALFGALTMPGVYQIVHVHVLIFILLLAISRH